MSYGIQVFNNNGNVLIDTLAQSQMQITQVTTHAIGTAGNLTRGDGEFILWSPQHNSGGNFTTTKFSQASNSDLITNHGTDAVNVIRLRDVAEATVPTRSSSDQYGIETYNANNVVTYSDLFATSYKILAIYPPGTITGGDTIYTGSTDEDEHVYVGAGSPWYFDNSYTLIKFGNFKVTSNSITFENHLIIPSASFNGVYPNHSTVVVLKIRNT